MKNKIEVNRLASNEEFESLQEEWNQLLSQGEIEDIFLTWEWLFAWWKAYGDKYELWLLTVRENGGLIGIAPLMLSTQQRLFLRLRVLLSIGTPQCDVSGFIATQNELVVSSIHGYLKQHKNEWDIFEMKALQKSTYEADLLPEMFLKSSGYRTIQKDDEHYYLPINEDWETYFKNLSKNLRRNLKRRLRRAEEQGKVTHKRYSGQNLTWDNFLTLFDINERGSYPDLYKYQSSRVFHKSLFDLMHKNGWIQIEMLYIDDEPVAFQYGYRINNKYQDWRGGYDSKYETLGTGKILMMFSIKRWFEQQIREVDFLRGTHDYKADWQPLTRKFIDLRIFRVQKLEALIAYMWLNTLKPILKRNQAHNYNSKE